MLDEGTYELTVSSSVPPYNQKLNFQIEVIDEQPLSDSIISLQTLIIIACSAAIFLIILGVLICICKRKKAKTIEGKITF